MIVGGSSPNVLNGGVYGDDDEYDDEEELEESEEEEEEEDDDDSNSLEEVDLMGDATDNDQTVVHRAQNSAATSSDVLNHIESIAGLIDTPEAKKPISSISP